MFSSLYGIRVGFNITFIVFQIKGVSISLLIPSSILSGFYNLLEEYQCNPESRT